MAHEMRNPLMSILAGTQLLRGRIADGAGNGDAHERLNIIERQAKNMGKLLEDVLDTSRLSRQKIILKKQPMNVNESVRMAVAVVTEIAHEKKQTISVKLARHPVLLQADPLRLEQMLGNLINNAVKYTQEGGRVWVAVAEKGRTVEISVRDNGQGIPQEKMRSIFKLFNRADAMPFSSIGSLGIGLNITKRLAIMHGGHITVRSKGKGKGSAFIVSLPRTRQPADTQTAAIPLPQKAGVEKLRVLVVDDNRDIARLISSIFLTAGHETLVAHDGLEAIKKAKVFKPQAAIIDIGLPGANGYQVAQAIKKQNSGGKVKLVALTGYGQEQDRQKSCEAGFDLH
ncbi:MAG: hybrid sensor histidine kinase/response regulator, partial [Candidatus Saccharimonadales bacterium]